MITFPQLILKNKHIIDSVFTGEILYNMNNFFEEKIQDDGGQNFDAELSGDYTYNSDNQTIEFNNSGKADTGLRLPENSEWTLIETYDIEFGEAFKVRAVHYLGNGRADIYEGDQDNILSKTKSSVVVKLPEDNWILNNKLSIPEKIIFNMENEFENSGSDYINSNWIPQIDEPWSIELTLTTNNQGNNSSASSGIWAGGQRCFLGMGANDDLIFGLGKSYDANYHTNPNTIYKLKMIYNGVNSVDCYINDEFYRTLGPSNPDPRGTIPEFNQVNVPFYIGAWCLENEVADGYINYKINKVLIQRE